MCDTEFFHVFDYTTSFLLLWGSGVFSTRAKNDSIVLDAKKSYQTAWHRGYRWRYFR